MSLMFYGASMHFSRFGVSGRLVEYFHIIISAVQIYCKKDFRLEVICLQIRFLVLRPVKLLFAQKVNNHCILVSHNFVIDYLGLSVESGESVGASQA